MSNTVTLDETIEVHRPLHEVFAYVSEFSRIQEALEGGVSVPRTQETASERRQLLDTLQELRETTETKKRQRRWKTGA